MHPMRHALAVILTEKGKKPAVLAVKEECESKTKHHLLHGLNQMKILVEPGKTMDTEKSMKVLLSSLPTPLDNIAADFVSSTIQQRLVRDDDDTPLTVRWIQIPRSAIPNNADFCIIEHEQVMGATHENMPKIHIFRKALGMKA